MTSLRPRQGSLRRGSFEAEARRTLTELRDSLRDVIEALPEPVRRPSDVYNILEIDRKLGWRLARAARSPDVWAMIEFLPGPAGLDIFLEAAASRSVPVRRIRAVRDAWARLEDLIERHAGDRESLAMMAKALADPGPDDAGLVHRREAFHGNSFIFGLQARTVLATAIVAPSASRNLVDLLFVWGVIDLRRIRHEVTWVLSRTGFLERGSEVKGSSRAAGTPPLPLLRAFCSRSLPDLHTRIDEAGMLEVELQGGPVGDRAAMTCIFTSPLMRGIASRHRTEQDSTAEFDANIRVPARQLIHDVLLHRSLASGIEPRAAVYNEMHDRRRSAAIRDERYRLPLAPPVHCLGSGASAVRTPAVPRYPQMIRHVCAEHNWQVSDFEVYRVDMEYPVLKSSVVISFDLPEPARSE